MMRTISRLTLIIVFFLVASTQSLRAQLIIREHSVAEDLVQKLLGQGISVSNISLTASPQASGFFNNISGTNIGIDSGIVLANGRVMTNPRTPTLRGMDGDGVTQAYIGASGTGAFASAILGSGSNADLSALLGGATTNDATVLKFDFIPLGDSIKFNYVFSSEEYPEFVCQTFNDAFAFFIEGPGFATKTNIALIPGTTDPVTINNINDVAGCGLYPAFYRSNRTNTAFTHNGHTTVLQAVARVQPCQTYTLTLVIADVGDAEYDSGVFLQAGSLSSNVIDLGGFTKIDPAGDNYLAEGCTPGKFEIRRQRKDPSPLTVQLSYGGTAVPGVDVDPLPLSVLIPAGDSLVTVNFNTIVDGMSEGSEKLVIYALAGCGSGTPSDSIIIYIRDYDTLNILPNTSTPDAFVCKNGTTPLTATAGYTTYTWEPDPTLSSTVVNNPLATPTNKTTKYICTATIGACYSRDSVTLVWKDIEFVSKTDVNCRGDRTGTIKTEGGTEWATPFEFSLDGTTWQPDGNFSNLPAGVYWVKLRDSRCIDSVRVEVLQSYPDLVIDDIAITPASCSGDPDGTVTITGIGGNTLYSYSSNGTDFNTDNIFHLRSGDYIFTLKDGNGCITTQAATVPLNNTVTVEAGTDHTICEGTDVLLPLVSNGTTFAWTPAATLDNATLKEPTASPSTTTKYYVTATTGICDRIDSVVVNIRPAPVADAGDDINICYGKVFELDGSGGVSYKWTPNNYMTTPANIRNPSVKATSNITYYLKVTDINGCESIEADPVNVIVTPAVKIFAGRDTVAAINQPIQLRVVELGTSGVTRYSWSPATFLDDANSNKPIATLPYDQRYIVTGTTADGCEGMDDILIKVYKGPDIYVPTGFTPDNNGLNDVLRAIPVGIREFRFFKVFNRWGQPVFATQNPATGWNGRSSTGVEQPTGTYIWVAEAVDYKGSVITRKGTVTIIR